MESSVTTLFLTLGMTYYLGQGSRLMSLIFLNN